VTFRRPRSFSGIGTSPRLKSMTSGGRVRPRVHPTMCRFNSTVDVLLTGFRSTLNYRLRINGAWRFGAALVEENLRVLSSVYVGFCEGCPRIKKFPITPIGCYTFRATGITDYASNGGRIEVAQRRPYTRARKARVRTTGVMRISASAKSSGSGFDFEAES
jgi:hypothetical protein